MVVLKADKVNNALKKKGFIVKTGRTDHCRFVFCNNGRMVNVKTYTSHNGQEIGDELQFRMAEQLHLSKPEFVEMISCTIGRDELVARYTALGLIRED
ncbi:hypothetical protein McpSp1_18100 [Methanocorpusculaceae archaeon Sp1]|nr:hypothetical protein [Methanocorpusculaceae archaeon Sp1]